VEAVQNNTDNQKSGLSNFRPDVEREHSVNKAMIWLNIFVPAFTSSHDTKNRSRKSEALQYAQRSGHFVSEVQSQFNYKPSTAAIMNHY
jgi:hypothetical protein